MKNIGVLSIFAFVFYLIGQIIWLFLIICDEPLFGSEFLDEIIIHQVFTLFGFFGLLAGIMLYKLNIKKSS